MRYRAGFTLIELIIFMAIFAVTMGAFATVFVGVSGVAVRQGGIAEVQSQSQFLLQTIQYHVERSSVVEIEADTPTDTLTLRMPSEAEGQVVIGLNGTAVEVEVGGDPAETITSPRVEVSDLVFTKHSNPGGKDSVSVSFTVAYATENVAQRFAQSLRTTVARVSAATFDSDILPDTGSTHQLGTSPEDWRSVNNTIFFSGSNVGIGTPSPGAPLEVSGDIYVSDSASGLILNDGSACWRVTVSGAGALVVTSETCPS